MNASEKKRIESLLHELIMAAVPKSKTFPKYGGVLYTLFPDEKEGQYCGIFAYRSHVQLSFANGAELTDPKGLLLGSGKYRRHINFESIDEVNEAPIKKLLKESASLSRKMK